jgi:RIO-like serine/threonine protein kinase
MPPLQIAQNLIRALQFFHECGYLYRNMHPSHVMMTYDNNIVIIDFKKMRRFVDIKGKHIEVVGDK